ncbi:hypothetical protein GCM10010140_38740 [Streptosporangium pseudovulgare]|uniref:Uncharacterized protein n=1 Tax=Streptosporangium pseudovulgare TaxID=35765 RepID=A0ABQ2QZF0_9ACTN|nr:hypothetical protein GCM10010140_38740 [Streptosporangium pseudovulgare]
MPAHIRPARTARPAENHSTSEAARDPNIRSAWRGSEYAVGAAGARPTARGGVGADV